MEPVAICHGFVTDSDKDQHNHTEQKEGFSNGNKTLYRSRPAIHDPDLE